MNPLTSGTAPLGALWAHFGHEQLGLYCMDAPPSRMKAPRLASQWSGVSSDTAFEQGRWRHSNPRRPLPSGAEPGRPPPSRPLRRGALSV